MEEQKKKKKEIQVQSVKKKKTRNRLNTGKEEERKKREMRVIDVVFCFIFFFLLRSETCVGICCGEAEHTNQLCRILLCETSEKNKREEGAKRENNKRERPCPTVNHTLTKSKKK